MREKPPEAEQELVLVHHRLPRLADLSRRSETACGEPAEDAGKHVARERPAAAAVDGDSDESSMNAGCRLTACIRGSKPIYYIAVRDANL